MTTVEKMNNRYTLRILQVGSKFILSSSTEASVGSKVNFSDFDAIILDVSAIELKGDRHGTLTETKADHAIKIVRTSFERLCKFANGLKPAICIAQPLPVMTVDFAYERKQVALTPFSIWASKKPTTSIGSNIVGVGNHPVASLINKSRGIWNYRVVFSGVPKSQVLAHVRDHPEEVVSFFIPLSSGGEVVVIPDTDGPTKTENMLRFQSFFKEYTDYLNSFEPSIGLPSWLEQLTLPGESEVQSKLSSLEKQAKKIEEQISLIQREIDQFRDYKYLLSGHGLQLERIIVNMLGEMGAAAELGPKTRADIHLEFNKHHFVIEVQGVVKGAREDHVRALTIWIEERAMELGQEPKGILLVCPFRDTPVNERSDNPWGGEITKLATRKEICAITTQQFLNAFILIRQNKLSSSEFFSSLVETSGVYDKYTDIEWQ